MRKIKSLSLLLLIILTGCNLPFIAAPADQTPIPITNILITSNPNSAPTPTPFQPMAPTPTAMIYNTPADGGVTVPVSQETQSPSSGQEANLDLPKGQVNILILGSDWRSGMGFRTDVIMLLSLNPQKGTASLTSFPRDLYVTIPGIGMERINTAQEFGGFTLTQATFQANFGFTPDYYIMTNFNGFMGIIDTLGGVTVNAATTLTDECSLPQNVNGYCTIYAGPNKMNGKTALWYVRSRHSTSDFDRTRRAQEVMTAVFQKIMTLDAVNRAPELYNQFISSVDTNIPASTIISLMPMAAKLVTDTSVIRRYAIGPAQVSNYIVPGSGAMVLWPNQAAVMDIIQQALYQ